MPPLSLSHIDNMIGLPTSRFVAVAASAETVPQDFEAVFTQEELIAVSLFGRLYPGISDMLRSVRDTGVKMAICSNGGQTYLTAACAHAKINDLFDLILPEQIGYSKSDMTASILRSLGVNRGVFVGDRTLDLTAARDNGLVSVGVTWGYGKEEPQNADIVVDSAEELEQVLLLFIEQNSDEKASYSNREVMQ